MSDGGLFYSRDRQDRAGSIAESKQNTDTDTIPVSLSGSPHLPPSFILVFSVTAGAAGENIPNCVLGYRGKSSAAPSC